jgi:hypothetical protein
MWYKNGENFKEENGYNINGEWYPRVTRIIQIKSKPALEHFFKEVGNYSSVQDIKNKSAEEGTVTHEIIQKLILGETPDVSREFSAIVTAFEKFNLGGRIKSNPDLIERKILSTSDRYAGTADALAFIDGKFGVLDIKTSTGFYPDYNLQTAAYVSALREEKLKNHISFPKEIETRWILRADQHRVCKKCASSLRLKGGRHKVRMGNGLASSSTWRSGRRNGNYPCPEGEHDWGFSEGIIELKEFPEVENDLRAFRAAKVLWEWENDYWLKQIGYL